MVEKKDSKDGKIEVQGQGEERGTTDKAGTAEGDVELKRVKDGAQPGSKEGHQDAHPTPLVDTKTADKAKTREEKEKQDRMRVEPEGHRNDPIALAKGTTAAEKLSETKPPTAAEKKAVSDRLKLESESPGKAAQTPFIPPPKAGPKASSAKAKPAAKPAAKK